MESILLSTHSILRWGVLIFGLYAITKAARGVLFKQDYTSNHRISGSLFLGFMHLQVVIGLVLYFMRGWASNLSKMGEIMGSTSLRFWTIEHIFGMIVAAVLIQMGSSKSKRKSDTHQKHKTAFTFFTIGMIIILATIPWPFRGEVARALWP